MAYSKKEIQKQIQKNLVGFETSTHPMDGTATVEVVELGGPASKVTVQSTGTLVFNWEISVNGENFVSAAAGVAAGVLSSYNTHNVSSVKVTRVSGSGRVAIACVS